MNFGGPEKDSSYIFKAAVDKKNGTNSKNTYVSNMGKDRNVSLAFTFK